jgi:hypothetical protein
MTSVPSEFSVLMTLRTAIAGLLPSAPGTVPGNPTDILAVIGVDRQTSS